MAVMTDILLAVARTTGIGVALLRNNRRVKPLSRARLLVYYFCRTESEIGKQSLPAIGRLMHRDHSTVLHGLRRHADLMKDETYRREWEILREKFFDKLAGVVAERHLRQQGVVDGLVRPLDAVCTNTLHIAEVSETALQCSPFLEKLPPS